MEAQYSPFWQDLFYQEYINIKRMLQISIFILDQGRIVEMDNGSKSLNVS